MTRLEELDIKITKRRNVTYAGIPQLGIYSKGGDAASALANLEKRTSDLVTDPEEMEFVAGLARAGGEARVARSVWRGVGVFAVKAAIFMGLFVGAVALSSAIIATRIERTVERVHTAVEPLANLSGKQFWAKIQREIGSAAKSENDLPETEKRELMANLRILANRWRPVATEAAGIFFDNRSPKDKTPGAD